MSYTFPYDPDIIYEDSFGNIIYKYNNEEEVLEENINIIYKYPDLESIEENEEGIVIYNYYIEL